ncbi:MAG: phage portal protein [Rhodospirillales bacterium]|nr:phage portal protein [Rhodospirillales bacterium]
MRWPWQKREPEQRSTAQGYTASLTAAFEGAAVAGTETAPLATAALEAAAGLYSRCMAAAVVRADPTIERALTPAVLALIARNLIRRGEDFHLIRVRNGRLELRPQGFTYAHGNSADPLAWFYSATEYGPTDSVHRWVPAASMLHCRYSVDSSRPWLGVPPWSWASSTGAAIAALERLVANEAKAPHGHLLGVPEAPVLSDDDDEGPLDGFRNDLAAAKGRTLVMERASDWKQGEPAGAARNGMEHVTYGLDRNIVDPLRTATGRDVLGACGVPPTLFVPNSDGTAQREAFRRFLHASLRPLARIMEAEFRSKLDAPDLQLDLSELHAADVSGRARSFGQLVKAGVHPEDAAANTGVVLTRDVRAPEGSAP